MKLSNIWKSVQKARDNFSFWLEQGASYGPSPEVRGALEKDGWKFRREVVVPLAAPAMPVDQYHPITPEGIELKDTDAEWGRYEQARITATCNLYNRPLPESFPGPRKSLSDVWKSVQFWAAKHEILGAHPAVMDEMKKDNWSFDRETVLVPVAGVGGFVDIYRPITPEGVKLVPGEATQAQWDRYEQARLVAVHRAFDRPLPPPTSGPSCGCS